MFISSFKFVFPQFTSSSLNNLTSGKSNPTSKKWITELQIKQHSNHCNPRQIEHRQDNSHYTTMICNCAFINTNKTTYKKRLRFQDGCTLDSVLISNLPERVLTLRSLLSGPGGSKPGNKSAKILLNSGTSSATNFGMLASFTALMIMWDSSSSKVSDSMLRLRRKYGMIQI